MTKPDRRVQRTRELLHQALIDLISERQYKCDHDPSHCGSRQRRVDHLLSE
jgi:hypothetical protein